MKAGTAQISKLPLSSQAGRDGGLVVQRRPAIQPVSRPYATASDGAGQRWTRRSGRPPMGLHPPGPADLPGRDEESAATRRPGCRCDGRSSPAQPAECRYRARRQPRARRPVRLQRPGHPVGSGCLPPPQQHAPALTQYVIDVVDLEQDLLLADGPGRGGAIVGAKHHVVTEHREVDGYGHRPAVSEEQESPDTAVRQMCPAFLGAYCLQRGVLRSCSLSGRTSRRAPVSAPHGWLTLTGESVAKPRPPADGSPLATPNAGWRAILAGPSTGHVWTGIPVATH